MLYEKRIEDIIESDLIRKVDKDNQISTIMMITDEIRLGIMQIRTRQPIQWTIEQIAIHGLSCMEHECSMQIDEIEKLQLKLSYAESRLARLISSGTKLSMDSFRKKIKQSVKIRSNIVDAMGRYADILSLDRSIIFRICVYFSFATSQAIVSDIKEKAIMEKENFKKQIEDMYETFGVLEKHDREKKNER